MKNNIEKKLYVGTVNGECSLSNRKADTYIRAYNPDAAALGLFKRYLKRYGKANVTDLFEVNEKDNSKSRVTFIVRGLRNGR